MMFHPFKYPACAGDQCWLLDKERVTLLYTEIVLSKVLLDKLLIHNRWNVLIIVTCDVLVTLINILYLTNFLTLTSPEAVYFIF